MIADFRMATSLLLLVVTPGYQRTAADQPWPEPRSAVAQVSDSKWHTARFEVEALRLAIEDLLVTHGDLYPQGATFLKELSTLEGSLGEATKPSRQGTAWSDERWGDLFGKLSALRRRALLANPAVRDLQVLCVRRD